MADPKLDDEARQDAYGLYSDDFYYRPCDAPDPECLCDRCRRDRGELSDDK